MSEDEILFEEPVNLKCDCANIFGRVISEWMNKMLGIWVFTIEIVHEEGHPSISQGDRIERKIALEFQCKMIPCFLSCASK